MRIHSYLLTFLLLSFVSHFVSTSRADENSSVNQQDQLVLKEGDRIVLIGNTFADQQRLNNYLETLLTSHAPVKNITFRNLAWSGDTLSLRPRPLNFGSLDEHLRQQKADMILACFGMNESFAGEAGLKQFTDDWEQFLKHVAAQQYNGKSAPQVVMISPIAHETMGPPLPDPAEHNQSLLKYTQAMKAVAAKYHVPFVDLFTASKKQMDENPSQKLTRNGIHLNEYGYWVIDQIIASQLLGTQIKSPQIAADMKSKHIQATSAKIIETSFQPDTIQFTVKEKTLPIPAPPASTIVHNQLLTAQPKLTVKNLPAGVYRLTVNGTPIAKASHSDWGRGLHLQNLPSQRQVNELRANIDRKNELFFYVYRAHNAEYIFGRRTKPFGAVSFPPEMQTFGKLIQQKETTIQKQALPSGTSRWELIRLE
ncbi:SGNH/GDSL hydrolase family protein [Gimesia aquarii]|uniref:GDSL-like Lipase/Acylhydrolase n=1 Tax=Gimesia aquarii TaxID=2527964 RepID=A0A517WQ41_9PLAN|nr:SGNH/GDSL hydrolase family protein [Gimesia aquarii]QDU07379.1 GDSL-like Lipase/Acylhydrolase [Gimesia aquarii]